MVTPTGAAAVVLFGWSETPTHAVLNSLPLSVTLLPVGPISMGANSLINDQRLGDGGLRTVTLPELPAGSGLVYYTLNADSRSVRFRRCTDYLESRLSLA